MSRKVLDHGRDRRVTLMARAIIPSQERQIDRMLELVPEAHSEGTQSRSALLAR